MKYLSYVSFLLIFALVAGLNIAACKDKAKDSTETTIERPTDTSTVSSGTPEIAADAALESGLKDATKDYPGVSFTIKDGEVTLTGTIERDKAPALLQSVNGLNPKKVNNQLTYK